VPFTAIEMQRDGGLPAENCSRLRAASAIPLVLRPALCLTLALVWAGELSWRFVARLANTYATTRMSAGL
jgi:hypothetical protein